MDTIMQLKATWFDIEMELRRLTTLRGQVEQQLQQALQQANIQPEEQKEE